MAVTIRDTNNIPKLVRLLDELSKKQLQIGIFGEQDSEILMIASVHEFGCRITVTPKMRAWFAYQGYPLRVDKTEIVIPERSYMRAGFDSNIQQIQNKAEMLLGGLLAFRITVDAFFEALGGQIVSYLKDYMTNLSEPPLSGMTIARKGSSNPLIDTGRLRQAITWQVVDK